MAQNILYYLGRLWSSLTPEVVNIKEADYWHDGEQYMYLLEDGTLLRFEDFDCEEECFVFSDGSKYFPLMEVSSRKQDGTPQTWVAKAFVRR